MKSRRPHKRPQKTHQKTQNLHNDRPITLEITDLSRGGSGFGRDEAGRAVFVPFTMAGDHVKVKLTKAKSKFAEGYVMDIITPSADRIDARCKVFGQCGGCQWQHIPYTQQWETKKQGVLNSLSLNHIKLDAIKYPVSISEFPAENIWHYRNRIQLRGFKDNIGFYANQSNDLVPIEQCHIAHPNINAALAKTKEQGEQLSKTNSNKPYKVELNLSLEGDVSQTWNDEHASSGFRQVNDEQNDQLKKWIADTIPTTQALLDLYGGAGNLSRQFINQAEVIHCVDLSTPDNSQDLGENFSFHRASVEHWLKLLSTKQLLTQQSAWTALIDPPREGLGKNGEVMIEKLKQFNVNQIVLVGCKTDPWSRDIALFIQHGWQLKKIAIFDFFPQTYHVESAAYLTKK